MRPTYLAAVLSLASAPALGQDTWSSPAPGVRLLVRRHRGAILRVATADVSTPELRPAVLPLAGDERELARAAAEHDAFLGLAASDGPAFVGAVRRLLDPGDGGFALGPEALWGAVGRTASGGLVLLCAERARVRAAVAEETLRSFGVVRAVPVRGGEGASLLLRGERIGRTPAQADALLAVRWLPGAVRADRATTVAPGVQPPPSSAAPVRQTATRELRVQTAGFSVPEGGPGGVAWLALSVLGCLGAALGRRARSEE